MGNNVCFVIMGFGKKTNYNTGKTIDLDKTYKNIIKPAVEERGYKCIRADEIKDSTLIDKSMYRLLMYADLVIADISTNNPNAIYELGIRHAVRPFHTIVLKDKDEEIPFDLSHLRILNYCHLGEDIGVDESKRCINELKSIIKDIKLKKENDSPLYTNIIGINPPVISQDEIDELSKELNKKQVSIYEEAEKAKSLMEQDKFSEATKIWENISEKVPDEAYYIQQHALCRYKSKDPSEVMALNEASIIINKLINKDITESDPETLGIAGAIYKNLYLNTADSSFLDKAIKYYGDGFNSRKDYYNGENYALCLNMKASLAEGEDEVYFRLRAKEVRREIIELLTPIIEKDNLNLRDDKKWIYATLANCHYAIGEDSEANNFEKKFRDTCTTKWEIDSYEKGKETLLDLLKNK